MSRIDELEQAVRALYEAKDPNRADWADFLYGKHVIVVADFASQLAERFEIDADLCRASALLHDIADAKTKRHNPEHAALSEQIATEILQANGYTNEDISVVVTDALRNHSCHDGVVPQTDVGKVLATADALAHLQTDFYDFFEKLQLQDKTTQQVHEMIQSKLDRDFAVKIQFDEIRQEAQADYERLKAHFKD